MHSDTSLASGNTHLLLAVGAFKIAMLFVLHTGLEVFQFSLHGPDHLEEPDIFRPTALHLSGKGSKQSYKNHHESHPVQDGPSGENGE